MSTNNPAWQLSNCLGKQAPGGGYPASARPLSRGRFGFDCDGSLRLQEAAPDTIKGSLRSEARRSNGKRIERQPIFLQAKQLPITRLFARKWNL